MPYDDNVNVFANIAKKTRTHARTHKLTHAEKLVHVRTCNDVLF